MGPVSRLLSFGNSSYLIDDKTVKVVRAGQGSVASTPPLVPYWGYAWGWVRSVLSIMSREAGGLEGHNSSTDRTHPHTYTLCLLFRVAGPSDE